MSIRFTDQQKNAIVSRGHSLLVSAAAGSGKTAVLVERVLRRISEEGGEIDRMMIMTFTSAAAEEMRQKIKRALEEKIRAQGGNDHLIRQSALVDSARIGTVHSICLDLITRHFEELDLDPRCRLLEDTQQKELAEQGAEALLEQLYVNPTPEEQRLLDCLVPGRNDDQLKELLLSGLEFLEGLPMADRYIEKTLEPYARTDEGLFACFADDGLYRVLSDQANELIAEQTALWEAALHSPYLSSFSLFLDFVAGERGAVGEALLTLEKRDYEQFRRAVREVKFETLTWTKVTEKTPDPEEKAAFNALREAFKKKFKAFADQLALSEAEELARIMEQESLLKTYLGLCNQLKKQLAADRRRNGWITYGDMEQLTVQLLVEPESTPEQPVFTKLAHELRQDFDEIVVDEFQDTNLTQDLIFRALSREGSNLFMVGDLKQSIYRFRGAEPHLFDQKRRESAPFTNERLTQPTVLELTRNFRSHPDVLAFCNRVFEGIMSPEMGGVTYDERERLEAGGTFLPAEKCPNEFHWLLPQTDEKGRPISNHLARARYAAGLIKEMVERKESVLLPNNTVRPVTYGDFAILLRTVKDKAELFERELRRLNIPVINQNPGEKFFDLPEVQDLLALLLVLNNPYDDIALVSLLYSPFFRFTVGELAALRVKKQPLYENMKAAAPENERVRAILERIETFRDLAGELYVYDLLYRIYRETGILAHYAAEPGGAAKIANMELLAEDARLFEKEGYRGLYAFVEHLRISESKTQGGARLEASGDSVRIMSIHKSKGLEFPVCIHGDPDRAVSDPDLKKPILIHSRYGTALGHYEPELFYHCKSLSQAVLADQMTADCVSEEERILYVALTRAVSKNILLVTAEEKKMEKWIREGIPFRGTLPRWSIKGKAPSYSHWIVNLLAYAEEGRPLRAHFGIPEPAVELPNFKIQCIGPLAGSPELSAAQTAARKLTFDQKAFRERLDWQYPHLKGLGLPTKLSVSELKGIREADPEAEGLLEEQVRMQPPRFASRFQARGNEVGNALHQALQFSDFEALSQDPVKELDRLAERHFITAEQRTLIPVEKIRRFTQSDVFRELLSADSYSKEERFLFPMAANELFGADAEGEILIQGVLDCYWVKGNEAVVLDYKTDRVQSPEELIRRYRVQMELYDEALKRMKGLTVTRRIIYSFSLEQAIIL